MAGLAVSQVQLWGSHLFVTLPHLRNSIARYFVLLKHSPSFLDVCIPGSPPPPAPVLSLRISFLT